MNKKLIWLAIFLIAVSGLVLTKYMLTKDSEPEKKIPVVRVLEERRNILFLPHYLAMELGFFAEQNIDVQLKTVPPGETAHNILDEGKADVIIAGPGQVILADPIKGVNSPKAFAEITQKDGSFFIARETNENFQWTDVKNRTIISGYPTEDTSLILEYILRQHEIAPNWHCNVIENLPIELRPGAFKSGSGSFIVVDEPNATLLENQQMGKVVASLGNDAGNMPAAVYMANPQYLDSKTTVVQGLVNGLHKTQQWMMYHSVEEMANLVADYFPDYERDLLIAIIKRYKNIDLWSDNPIIDKVSYDNLYTAIESSGELVNKSSYSKAVTNHYAQRAVRTVHYVPEDKQKPKPGLNWRYIKSLFS
ncbi:ABC transporter substrate-binding protein [Peptococcaceae bacterium 1198_IL3148]